jgi:hypothetical protein
MLASSSSLRRPFAEPLLTCGTAEGFRDAADTGEGVVERCLFALACRGCGYGDRSLLWSIRYLAFM